MKFPRWLSVGYNDANDTNDKEIGKFCIGVIYLRTFQKLCHQCHCVIKSVPLKSKGAFLLRFRGKRHSGISIGSRYRSRSAAHIVWEVIAQYEGADRQPYVVLENLFDRTRRKTMSQTELERGEQYSRVTEGFQSR